MPDDARGRTDAVGDHGAFPHQLRPTVYCPPQRVHACLTRADAPSPRMVDA